MQRPRSPEKSLILGKMKEADRIMNALLEELFKKRLGAGHHEETLFKWLLRIDNNLMAQNQSKVKAFKKPI